MSWFRVELENLGLNPGTDTQWLCDLGEVLTSFIFSFLSGKWGEK